MSDPLIQHVSDTAFMVAHWRGLEGARRKPLFRDPLATLLAGDKGKASAEDFPTARMSSWMIAIRTVVIDDLIRAALARGVNGVLCLGAGLDTRPYRMELPSELPWLEVDYPNVIAFKEDRLKGESPHCRVERIGLDLANVTERRELFARVDARATRILVLTEGLVPYLDLQQAGSLADDLHALSHLESWIVDYVSKESHAYRQRAGVNERMRQVPFKFQPDDWFAFFAKHGWKVGDMRYLPEEGARMRRPAPLPRMARILIALGRMLAPPEKRGRFTKFSGYASLVPTTRPG